MGRVAGGEVSALVARKDLGLWESHPEGCSGTIRVNAELWPFS